MIVILLCVLLQVLASNASQSILNDISERNIPEDGRLNFTELARKYKLNVEEIEVETEDGYLIDIFHIPGKRKPVLLLHGLGDSSIAWLLRGNKSLAVALAREGYDAWYGNVRGNKYGRKHVSLNPDEDDQFWDYSLNEIGFYDWRAMIDRVLKVTNETKLNTIGHSQGVSSLLALLSTKPEYNEKINLNIGLAGVAYLEKVSPAITLIAQASPVIMEFFELLGINEILSNNSAENDLLRLLCTQGYVTEVFCRDGLISLFIGYDPFGIEAEFLPVILGQFPAGTSINSINHFLQILRSKKYAKYDYGILKNLSLYGTVNPPEYNLTQITAKMALMYGESDVAATPNNVIRLARALPNAVYVKAIENKLWNHLDFTWSNETQKYLFGHIFKLLKQYDY